MKTKFTTHSLLSLLSLVFITSSCGSNPEVKEPAIKAPIVPPSEYLAPALEEGEVPVSFNQTAIPVNSAIPIARRVAGRPGFVFNPYNQNMVEVDGIASGTKARDPQDANPNHIFMVP